jgi:ATP-dependent 26S proteasome regulatory subunit
LIAYTKKTNRPGGFSIGNKTLTKDWDRANQRYLLGALALVKNTLECYLVSIQDASIADTSLSTKEEQQHVLQQELEDAASTMPAPSHLEVLCETFALTPFERDILLLCAGIELDRHFASLCVAAQKHTFQAMGSSGDLHNVIYPTFGLALAVLPQAHWNALTPAARLRYWHLLELGNGNTLTLSPLRIDEYILHYLVGISYADTRLTHLVTTLSPSTMDDLVPSQYTLAQRITAAWSPSDDSPPMMLNLATHPQIPIIQLCGEDSGGKYSIAAAVCDALGLHLKRIDANALSPAADDLVLICRLWERSAAINGDVLLLDCTDIVHNAPTTDPVNTTRSFAVTRLLQHVNSPLIVTSRERLSWPGGLARPVLTIDVSRPSISEQHHLWSSALKAWDHKMEQPLEQLVAQFSLSASAIQTIAAEALSVTHSQKATIEHLDTLLWDTCRQHARPALDELSQRIKTQASWHDLVLPEAQQQMLREIVAQVRQRTTVYETWNFKPAGATRGMGISALFAGASGTGKTLAAEVLAHELRLDLYRIDLSSVVSKYIGETEKNLRRVFDAAEEGGVVLLFDEADALFGKRSEVKDSHDRHANIEVSYLLQRMETYRGLAVLTTNLKHALDPAFLRRLRFVIQFPFPDMAQRAEMWRRTFPPSLPTSGLNIEKLARLHIAGGNIRNIALNAAFLAADAEEPLQMKYLLRAAVTEYNKLEKPLTETEIGGWI